MSCKLSELYPDMEQKMETLEKPVFQPDMEQKMKLSYLLYLDNMADGYVPNKIIATFEYDQWIKRVYQIIADIDPAIELTSIIILILDNTQTIKNTVTLPDGKTVYMPQKTTETFTCYLSSLDRDNDTWYKHGIKYLIRPKPDGDTAKQRIERSRKMMLMTYDIPYQQWKITHNKNVITLTTTIDAVFNSIRVHKSSMQPEWSKYEPKPPNESLHPLAPKGFKLDIKTLSGVTYTVVVNPDSTGLDIKYQLYYLMHPLGEGVNHLLDPKGYKLVSDHKEIKDHDPVGNLRGKVVLVSTSPRIYYVKSISKPHHEYLRRHWVGF
jgi:hypothetical protein